MGIPILHTITPPTAAPGLRLVILGFNLEAASLVLADGVNPEIVLSPEPTPTDTRIEVVIPVSTGLGAYTATVRNQEGSSSGLRLLITDDPLLGFPLCLPARSAEDYRKQARHLIPEGRPWATSPASNFQKVIGAVSEEAARVNARACELRHEITPATTVDGLEDWEIELGLPEPCGLYAPQDFEARRLEVIRKFQATGGNSIEYFRNLAALMGLNVVIYEEPDPTVFLVGRNRMGDRLRGAIWLFTWYIEILDYEINYFRVGLNTMGTPLRWWGAETIECYFSKLKPAHTNLVIRFAPLGGGRWGFGFFPWGISPHGL